MVVASPGQGGMAAGAGPVRAVRARLRWASAGRLPAVALHGNLGRKAGRTGRDVDESVPIEDELPALIDASPVRKRAALNVKDQGVAIHHVGPEMRDAALGDG